MYFKQLIPAMVLLCPFTIASLAPASYADNIKQIEVIGEKIEARSISEVSLDNYNGFESIVTRDAFEDRLVEISQIINELPSVQTFSTGGTGSYSSASIRGSTGKQVNIYIDGILLSSPLTGYSNLGIIPSSIIEAIEVYPDYTPVQLTDGNLAGAINIRTRKLDKRSLGGKAGVAYGSFDTRQADGSIWGGNNTTSMILTGSYLSSENNFPVSPDLFPNVSSGNSDERENAAFSQDDVFGKLQHSINDYLSLNVMTNYSKAFNELATMQNKDEAAATLDTENIRSSIGIESLNESFNWGNRLYTQQSNNTYKDLEQSISLQKKHIKLEEKTLGNALFLEYALQQHTLNTSLDINKAWIDKTNQLDKSEKIATTREKLIVAFSEAWKVTSAFSLYGLVRLYHVNDQSEAELHTFSASCLSNSRQCLDSKHREHSEQVGASYAFNENWSIKSNYAQLVRIPTLAEKFGEFGNYVGDPDLKPETSNTLDIGIRFSNSVITTQLSGYSKDITDGIYVAYDSRGVGHPSNTSKATIIGAEYSFVWLINDMFTYDFSAYTMDSENQSNIKSDVGKKLHGIYHYGYFSSLNWQLAQHNINASYQLDDDLYYTAANTVKAGSKESLNLMYSWQFQSWIFNVSGNNLLDKQYSDFNRMPNAGRHFSTSVHYKF